LPQVYAVREASASLVCFHIVNSLPGAGSFINAEGTSEALAMMGASLLRRRGTSGYNNDVNSNMIF
jgi:hypothetical protein